MENPGETVTKAVFAKVFKSAWDISANVENAVKGFKEAGLFPYKPSAVIENPKLGPSCLFPEFKHDPLPVTSTATATVDDDASIVSTVLPSTVIASDDDNASIVSTVLTSRVTVTVDDNTSSATVDDNATVLSTVYPSTVTSVVDDNASIVTESTVLPTCHIENIPTARPITEVANVSNAEIEAVDAEIPALISHTQSISEASVSRDSFAKFLQLPKAKETSARRKTYVPLPKALSGLQMNKILTERKEKKEHEEREKKRRKEEREERKRQKEMKSSKPKQGKKKRKNKATNNGKINLAINVRVK
ncbi:Hypothetical predicted protein [Mytilus galloprovincialis]|uniref:Uncharacterized protein n=1 Tax=Mytilus galloprovincialis TaxID=29158 RepID=A0A8B6FL45_MYTGA|nr:Hypothetical predicted protein [Mytilus galloprovincialis]